MSHLFKFMRYLFYMNLVFIFACSGGEGGTGVTPPTSPDISVGTITQFGSIYVNGIKFDTTSSTIDLDGTAGNTGDLRLGMVVTVRGNIDANGLTGTANQVQVKEVIKGPVSNNDGINTFTILGQTIQVTSTTKFDEFPSGNITEIINGSIVEVSGYIRGDGIISATRIELLNASETQFKVTGTVKNLSTQNRRFELGNLAVNYNGVSDNDLPAGFDNGLFVEVNGNYDSTGLNATEIERDELDIDDADEMELEGYVTSVITANRFRINNITVQTDANTQFDGGTLTDIAQGILLEVEGALVNGVLMANKIEFEDSVNIEAAVASVDLGAASFTLSGMGGISITTNALTEFDDGITGLGDIENNNTLKIHGNPINATTVLATILSLQSETPQSDISLQGPLTDILAPNITILGLTIDTTFFDDDAFELEDTENGRSNFFNTVKSNDIVEAEGTLNGATITWTSVSFEN